MTARERPAVRLRVLDDVLAVCRLPAEAPAPPPPPVTALFSLTRTSEELSVVCPTADAPPGSQVETGWRALAVVSPLDFGLTGILASIAEPLAAARIPIFALSTYDTDYVLVRESDVDAAVTALRHAGHAVAARG